MREQPVQAPSRVVKPVSHDGTIPSEYAARLGTTQASFRDPGSALVVCPDRGCLLRWSGAAVAVHGFGVSAMSRLWGARSCHGPLLPRVVDPPWTGPPWQRRFALGRAARQLMLPCRYSGNAGAVLPRSR